MENAQQDCIEDLIKLYELNNENGAELPIQVNHGLTIELNDEKENHRELSIQQHISKQ